MEMKLPLRKVFTGEGQFGAICDIHDANDSQVAEYIHGTDAEFIVRACNAHEDLLNALEDVLSVLHGKSSGTPEQNLAALESVVASALLKAKEPPHGAP